MAILMGAVVAVIFAAAARYILGHPHAEPDFFTRPFYDPRTFYLWRALWMHLHRGADVYWLRRYFPRSQRKRRIRGGNILLATVMTCVVIGLLSAVEVYVAQLIWPAVEKFPDLDTAYVYVAARAWKPLFWIVGCTLLLANFGSGMGAQIGAARLLYGMGRSNALPKSFFGVVDERHRVSTQQRCIRRRCGPPRRVSVVLRTRSGDAEFRRAHRLYGCEISRHSSATTCAHRKRN